MRVVGRLGHDDEDFDDVDRARLPQAYMLMTPRTEVVTIKASTCLLTSSQRRTHLSEFFTLRRTQLRVDHPEFRTCARRSWRQHEKCGVVGDGRAAMRRV